MTFDESGKAAVRESAIKWLTTTEEGAEYIQSIYDEGYIDGVNDVNTQESYDRGYSDGYADAERTFRV